MESWDDFLLCSLLSNLTYLHSKGVKNAVKHKLSIIPLVINEPWRQWWRHHDVIKWGWSLTRCHHSYQVWWQSDEKRLSKHGKKPNMSYKKVNRANVLGYNFRSGWNFDMGSSSTESWDDSLSGCWRSKLTYRHSKRVKNAVKHKLSIIPLVINEPWRQWWRHHDDIQWGWSLTPCHHSY